ncbi:hypothetical protein GCM10027579_13450 [Calidifontibacter terrae]
MVDQGSALQAVEDCLVWEQMCRAYLGRHPADDEDPDALLREMLNAVGAAAVPLELGRRILRPPAA